MRKVARVLASALVLPALAVAQRTFVVQGHRFAFRDAVRQAVHGDVLLVRAGTYSANLGVTQGIAVLCDAGVLLHADGVYGAGLSIADLPAGRVFRMRGGGFLGSVFVPPLSVWNCVGTVVLEDVGVGVARVENSRAVAFTRCSLAFTTVDRSTATFADCTIRGGATSNPSGGAALTATQSDVAIAGGLLRGGDALWTLPATAALSIDRSHVTIAGAGSTTLAGGNGPVPAVESTTGTLALDPTVTVTAGTSPAIAGNVLVTRRRIPAVTTSTDPVTRTFSVTSWSEPGSRTHVLLDLPLMQPVASIFGTRWVSPAAVILDSGITPTTGARRASLALPPLPAGLPVTLQPLTRATSGRVSFGPPTLVVLD